MPCADYRMKPRTSYNLTIVLAVVCIAGGVAMFKRDPTLQDVILASIVTSAGHALFSLGAYKLARIKGWQWWVGILFAFFGFVGFVAMTQLSERPGVRNSDDDGASA